jgi:hypothetical protein
MERKTRLLAEPYEDEEDKSFREGTIPHDALYIEKPVNRLYLVNTFSFIYI